MISSVTGNASNILTYLNGRNPSLSYKGGYLDPLCETTVGEADSYTAGFAFLFGKCAGNSVFG